MPTLVILATTDTSLADAWEGQLSPGRIALRFPLQGIPTGTAPGVAAVVILDAACESSLPASLARCPTVYVGEPRSLPFEQARMTGRGRAYLSYGESLTRLRELLPLLEEVAEKHSLVEMLAEKNRRLEMVRPAVRTPAAESMELWDFIEGAVENIDSRDRVIGEFRRATRQLLRASHAVFFHRETDGFRADRGTSYFAADDPLVSYFENHPAVIDGTIWDGPSDPVFELAVRSRLALWGARLLVPIHDNGRLLGLIALGVRVDGQPYDDADRNRAVFFARLLRHFLAKAGHFYRLSMLAEQTALGSKYLPGTLVLGHDENVPRQVPLVVHDLIGRSRRTREVCRVAPSEGQPFRASAGVVAETGGIWAFWEEASVEVHETAAREQAGRRGLLRDLAFTLGHEVGNALVSLLAFRHAGVDVPLPGSLVESMKGDIAKLEALNDHFTLMQGLNETPVSTIDLRDLAQSIGSSLGLRVEVGPDPVILSVSQNLLDFAIRALIRVVAENRPDQGTRELALKVRSTGTGAELTALLSLKGRNLELEGILPEPSEGGVPNQGRLGVFLAKEILRLHHGEIHAGPGMEGTEILISVRKW